MATVLRVKRRNDEEPHNALVIACKKRKIEAGASTEVGGETSLAAVVKFAGTLENQEDDIVEHLNKTLSKEQLKSNYKLHVADIANKTRLKTTEDSKANRYKIVNYNRSINSGKTENDDKKIVTLVDVEDATPYTDNAVDVEKDITYVYDLYFTQTEEEWHVDDDLSILPFEEELVHCGYRDKRSSEDCDSEDSNSESNWRNDYPDSDHSANSIDEDDMRRAVLRLDRDMSDSSTEDEDYAYAVDEDDVNAFGHSYARYKARIKNELEDSNSS